MQDPAAALALVNQQIVSAYCGIAELYMTDLCDEPDAEARCEECVAGALLAAPDGIETLYLLGNLRLCQNKREEAVAAVRKLCTALLNASDGV